MYYDNAVTGLGRALTDYQRTSNRDSLGEARILLDALEAMQQELEQRHD
jgi:hypothetical protein